MFDRRHQTVLKPPALDFDDIRSSDTVSQLLSKIKHGLSFATVATTQSWLCPSAVEARSAVSFYDPYCEVIVAITYS
jgi:hypothetical protein